MKKTLLILLILVSGKSSAQGQLTDNLWYLHTLVIDELTFNSPIPTTDTMLYFSQGSFFLDHWQCSEVYAAEYEATDLAFSIGSGVSLLGFGCSQTATYWYGRDYTFYSIFPDVPQNFTYVITPLGDELQLVVTNAAGDQAFYSNVPLSTSEVSRAQFNIYPNPADDVVMFSGVDNIYDVEIYNIYGHLVLSQNDHASVVNVSGLASGMYILTATAGNGIEVRSKFLKR